MTISIAVANAERRLPLWLGRLSLLLAFLCVHTAVWTSYALLSHRGGLHPDMLEAYSWGREFQLGYYKHPPFWAWIAGAWFEIFPRTNAAFYLLATLNSGIAVLGVWQLAGLLTRSSYRFSATALLLLLPAYTLQGHQYNANFILVSLWPWTAYVFVRSMETRNLLDAVLLAVLAAAAMLSKYYSVFLLASCFAASFFHPDWRLYYRSAAPYVAAALCALLVAPHVWWLVQHDFPTFRYAESRAEFPTARVVSCFITFNLGALGVNALPALLITAASWGRHMTSREREPKPIAPGYARFCTILALGPFCLTLASALLGHFRISTNFASPIFFLMPLLIIHWLRPAPERLRWSAIGTIVLFSAGALLAASAVPPLSRLAGTRPPKPFIEAAKSAAAIWSRETGAPLRIIAGSLLYAEAAVFYTPGDASHFIDFSKKLAPWITDARLAREGLLIICPADDALCLRRAAAFSVGAKVTDVTLSGIDGPPVPIKVIAVPPVGNGADLIARR